MIIDTYNEFSDGQAITADAVSDSVVDLLTAGDAIGNEMYLVVQVDAAFNTLTNLTISLETDTDEDFGGSPVLLQSFIVLLAALTINTTVVVARIPRGCERYLRMDYNVVGTDPTTGSISAFLVQGDQLNDFTS